MTLNQLSIWAIGISFLSGCGGGNKATATPPGNDISIPVVGSVFNEPLSNGKLYVTANANDNTGVTGYCFASASTKPLGTDKCFTSAASQTIDIPTTASPTYFVWAKDAANNVSATFSIDIKPPSIASASVSAPNNGKVTLSVNASDNVGIDGYCFTTSPAVPVASDACFTNAATKTIDTPTSNSPIYYAFAKDSTNNVSAPLIIDSRAPSIASASVSAPSNGKVTLSVNASDNTVVTGYCFTTSPAVPLASDACFTNAATKTIDTPSLPVRYYASVKDGANNVSAAFQRVAGPCSVAGVTASQASALPSVCMSTSLGEMVVELEASKAPISTTNFLKYVNDGYYSQTVFHRILRNFAIQGGGFTAVPISSNTKTGTIYPPIELEQPAPRGLSNTRGTLAMARTGVLNSATREFFINTVDNLALNTNGGGYAVFGKVISGLETTVEAIRLVTVEANSGGEVSQPVTPPVINWAYQLK